MLAGADSSAARGWGGAVTGADVTGGATGATATSGDAVRAAAAAVTVRGEALRVAAGRLDASAADWRGSAAESADEHRADLVRSCRRDADLWDEAADVLRSCAAVLDEAAALRRHGSADADELSTAAVRKAAARLRELTPHRLHHRRSGGRQVRGFLHGAWTTLNQLADVSSRLAPGAALLHPLRSLETVRELDLGLVDSARHPRQAAGHLLGLDLLQQGRYGEWLGGLVAGAAVPGGRITRLEEVTARSATRLVDVGGPVVARRGLQLPAGFPQHIKDLLPTRRSHILDGDGPDRGGGHRSGVGKPGKTEFPADWTDDDIIDRVMQTAMQPTRADLRRGSFVAEAEHAGVTIRVVVKPDGQVWTAYPLPGGRGVLDNLGEP